MNPSRYFRNPAGQPSTPELRAAGAGGYTLIEMLVVILVMGLFLGLVSAIVRPDERSRLHTEAERLAHLLNLAAAESRLTGKTIRWTSDNHGYRFLRLQEDDNWFEVQDSDLLRPRSMPDGIAITGLRIESTQRQNAMRLDFRPHGLPLAYNIDLSLGAERIAVAAAPFGDAQPWSGSEYGNATQ